MIETINGADLSLRIFSKSSGKLSYVTHEDYLKNGIDVDGDIVVMRKLNLKDWNGRDIWEGDILEAIHSKLRKEKMIATMSASAMFVIAISNLRVEIVGNIFETGEVMCDA